jgi:hypothetical protein
LNYNNFPFLISLSTQLKNPTIKIYSVYNTGGRLVSLMRRIFNIQTDVKTSFSGSMKDGVYNQENESI